MKNKLIIPILTLLLSMVSCTLQDEPYKEYYQEASTHIYPQKVSNLKAVPGYLRAIISWDRPLSPTVKRAVVYWNNQKDSVLVDLADESLYIDNRCEVTINDLNEEDYTFNVYTFNAQGTRSLPVEVSTTPVGQSAFSGDNVRRLEKAVISQLEGIAMVMWSSASRSVLHTDFRYVSGNGEVKTIQVPPSQNETDLSDLDLTDPSEFEYRTAFWVTGCVDTLYSDWIKGTWFVDPDYMTTIDPSIDYVEFQEGDNPKKSNVEKMEGEPYGYRITNHVATGQMITKGMKSAIKGPILVFQYKLPTTLSTCKIYWVDKGGAVDSKRYNNFPNIANQKADGEWHVAVIDMSSLMTMRSWYGNEGDYIRLDPAGSSAGISFEIRNVHFRAIR